MMKDELLEIWHVGLAIHMRFTCWLGKKFAFGIQSFINFVLVSDHSECIIRN